MNEQTYWNNTMCDEHYNNTFIQWVGNCEADSKLYI